MPTRNIVGDFYQPIKVPHAKKMPVSWWGKSDNFLNTKRKATNSHHKNLYSGVLQVKCFEQCHIFTNVWQAIRDKQNIFEAFWVKARTAYSKIKQNNQQNETKQSYGLNKWRINVLQVAFTLCFSNWIIWEYQEIPLTQPAELNSHHPSSQFTFEPTSRWLSRLLTVAVAPFL